MKDAQRAADLVQDLFFKADIQNVLNTHTAVYTYFDRRISTMKDVPHLALLPVIRYTLRF